VLQFFFHVYRDLKYLVGALNLAAESKRSREALVFLSRAHEIFVGHSTFKLTLKLVLILSSPYPPTPSQGLVLTNTPVNS
jgi:hypothetical protein